MLSSSLIADSWFFVSNTSTNFGCLWSRPLFFLRGQFIFYLKFFLLMPLKLPICMAFIKFSSRTASQRKWHSLERCAYLFIELLEVTWSVFLFFSFLLSLCFCLSLLLYLFLVIILISLRGCKRLWISSKHKPIIKCIFFGSFEIILHVMLRFIDFIEGVLWFIDLFLIYFRFIWMLYWVELLLSCYFTWLCFVFILSFLFGFNRIREYHLLW